MFLISCFLLFGDARETRSGKSAEKQIQQRTEARAIFRHARFMDDNLKNQTISWRSSKAYIVLHYVAELKDKACYSFDAI
jgi:hypothetical protein